MANVQMFYGSYEFRPVPFMGLSKVIHRTGDGTPVGQSIDISLDGTLITYPSGGYYLVDDLKDDLKSNLVQDGALFLVICDDNIIISGYPVITEDVEFGRSNDNEVFTCPYTVGFRFADTDTTNGNASVYGGPSSYIESFTENWQVEFGDKAYYKWTLPGGVTDENNLYDLRITHTVSAQGRRRFTPTGLAMPAWQQAQNYVVSQLGLNQSIVVQSGVLNLGVATSGVFDHLRAVNIDETDGVYGVTETFVVLASGAATNKRAIEDFTVTIRKGTESPIITVSLDGTIQGLEKRNYNSEFSIEETKFDNASGLYVSVANNFYGRAQFALNLAGGGTLNPVPLVSTVGLSPTNGVISYGVEYNTRKTPCLASMGAIFETLTIDDQGATDVVASFLIPGRGLGPILQGLNTTTAPTRTVNYEAVFEDLPDGCPSGLSGAQALMAQSPESGIRNLVDSFELALENEYSQVFVTEDRFTWMILENRASMTKTWLLGNC